MAEKKKKNGKRITQEELREYHERKERIEQEKKLLDAQKQTFIDRHGLGSKIEAGPFVLYVDPVEQTRVNSTTLLNEVAKEVGESKAQEMKEAASKKTSYQKVTVKKIVGDE